MLKQVVAASPDSPVFNYHLGMASYKSGDNDSAKTYLSKALEKDSVFNGRSEAESTLKQL